MVPEFNGTYFDSEKETPRAKMLASQDISTTDDLLDSEDLTDILEELPQSQSILIVIHGHDERSTDLSDWAKFAEKWAHLNVYFACCDKDNEITGLRYWAVRRLLNET